MNPPVFTAEKQEPVKLTGYIRSFVDEQYALIVVASSQHDAVEGDLEDMLKQGKLLIVPVPAMGHMQLETG
ncbi:hypothetical protein B7C51_21040 [Paenibacillus larvae subsp. pulvifaciens]|uniref:Uncharacterized protein n=1 Tax=Paenibacillus larvae subsp. pulvifaciens TaxID=1477 RepID=A0A1V0UXF9_9BACL|nr:hypothetical protein B7C51_21040 [Paenibacillus larvae subsp. pulvifaciens]